MAGSTIAGTLVTSIGGTLKLFTIIVVAALTLGFITVSATALVDRATCPGRQGAELDHLETLVNEALPDAEVHKRDVQCQDRRLSGYPDPTLWAYVGDLHRNEVFRAFKDAGWTTTNAPRGATLLSPDGDASMHMGVVSARDNLAEGLPAEAALFWVRPEPYTWPTGD